MQSRLQNRFTDARIARLATVTADGAPHVVPVVFAVAGDTVYTAVDDKPKTTRRLRRLDNIAATGRVSLLVDHYDEDWSRLWWVRVDGDASVLPADSAEGTAAIDALTAKYAQYSALRPGGPVIAIRDLQWRGWTAS
ncbi:TIGR03668 family PPOX class F420-dependent oxidoreductase [Rhodococcus sp. ABRD24]|uniref:TIGR03668 family PPOX class F420-dependent oxidoreductase n=1 Tax=Rhodococcus sp. ABRD24 TaxID=2507582 RepID=UPI001038A343|nr:TIGR03668 family PPOX class F420-dependent oxidoreductase [Rhodococcus sp. ABRD24]QBJ95971.1 TIGR03668 family PPOX class F420-dependent oxidoreductase [Rhodococcus sp. ABRD24]